MEDKREMLQGQRGMTLIEVLAVVVLIGLISVVVVRNVFSKGEAAKAQLNLVKMEKVKSYLGQFRLQYNRSPSRLEELLNGPSGQGSGESQPFVALAEKDELDDIWGFPLLYQTEGDGRSFVLKSLGSDGVAGGDGPKQDVSVRP